MNQCVPSWDLDDNPAPPRIALRAHSNSSNHVPSSLDYEVAELTWENGQLAMHRLGLPRVVNKPAAGSTWEKPSSGGTLESIVNQAKWHPHAEYTSRESLSELVPWFNHHRAIIDPAASSGGATMTMDALVPCNKPEQPALVLDSAPGSCGFSTAVDGGDRYGRLGISGRKTSVSLSASESATCGGEDNRQLTLDTCDLDGATFTTTSPENTSSDKEYTCDDRDSVYHIRFRSQRKGGNREHKKKGIIGKSSASTKRSRAAASHNQSERKRRDKINQRMNTLQKMVPNCSKIDKASMLDEVIEYLKQLQAQVHMMSRMSMPSMMLPLAMQQQQQQLQVSMMGMGTGMGMNPAATMPSVAPFMPISWDNLGDRLASRAIPDPVNTFLTCQSQMQAMSNVDAYARLAVMYQQLQQNHWSGPRN